MPSTTKNPSPQNPNPNSKTIQPIKKTLPKTNDRITVYPITRGPSSIPSSLLEFLTAEYNGEVTRGCTYPMVEVLSPEKLGAYWLGGFAVVVVLDDDDDDGADGDGDSNLSGLREGRDWEKVCLGTFFIKPNYPGRCSHVCNGGFLTTIASRGKGIGTAMGEAYLEYAPKLGYTYSVFNHVFANNMASIKTWEKLGFNAIGRVPGCARLENSDELVDVLIYGRKV